MIDTQYRIAPKGFTLEQWETFLEDGIIFIENAISEADIQLYTDAIDRVTVSDPNYVDGEYYYRENIVELDPTLAGLIDNPRHVGFAYDIYGELLKIHQTQMFVRVPQETHNNKWHPDGARALPYGVFSPHIPLQIKIGYWLTDLPGTQMGNLVVLPGSHRHQYIDGYDTHESVEGEQILKVKRGTMSIMHSSIWHRVEPNFSDVTRKNFFIAYCPAWLTAADRIQSDPDWIETLNREQRIIMRSYVHSYHNAKPPATDFPLFLDRETGSDRDTGKYQDHVQLHRRKRLTFHEKIGN
jgi:hypothetical protein